MSGIPNRTIEQRLEQIENVVNEIKILLKRQFVTQVGCSERPDGNLMNVKDVAKFVKVESSAIYFACKNNKLKFIRMGKHYKFQKNDVLEWIKNEKNNQLLDVDDYVNKYLEKNVLKG